MIWTLRFFDAVYPEVSLEYTKPEYSKPENPGFKSIERKDFEPVRYKPRLYRLVFLYLELNILSLLLSS